MSSAKSRHAQKRSAQSPQTVFFEEMQNNVKSLLLIWKTIWETLWKIYEQIPEF